VAEGLIVVYEIYLATREDSDHASRRLADLGFDVEHDITQAPAGAPFGLRASINTASKEEASAKLDEALAGIPRDPIVHYQEQRLTNYTPG
jgi:hypothetical protein